MNILPYLVASAVFTIVLLWLFRRDDSELIPPDMALPELTAVQCCVCKKVRTTDRRWLPPEFVEPPPPWATWSDGYCASCQDKAMLEIAKLPPRK